MKLYLCTWGTNYGLDICVVSAPDKAKAIEIAYNNGAWPTLEVNEIVPSDKEEVIKIDFYNNYGG